MLSQSRTAVSLALVALSPALALLLAGCGDSGEKPNASDNARLSALSTSAGELAPTFSPAVTQYHLTVPRDSAHVTLTPVTEDAAAKSITMAQGAAAPVAVANGEPSPDLTLPEPSAPASLIKIVVTAEDGVATQTYAVLLSQAESSDASLSALSVSVGSLYPAFASEVTTYRAAVPDTANATSITLTPEARSPHVRSITVSQDGGAAQTVASGAASSSLAVPAVGTPSVITVEVVAEDGTALAYEITLLQTLITDASLASLSVSAGTLAPAFAADTTGYDVVVPNGTATITVTPTASSPAITGMTIAGAGGTPTAIESGTASSPFLVPPFGDAPGVIAVEVTAEDGTTTRTYTLSVTEEPADDASLASLAVSAGTLAPAFTSDNPDYSLVLPSGTSSFNVTPTAAAPVQSIAISQDGSAVGTVASGSASAPLAVPAPGAASTVRITVTAQDSTTTASYAIELTQAAPGPAPIVWFREDFESGNTDNWDLTPSEGIFSIQADPYDPANHVLQYVAGGTYGRVVALLKDSVWESVSNKSDYYVEARISPYSNGSITDPTGGTTGQKQLYLMARYQDADNFYGGGMNLQLTSPRRVETRVFSGGSTSNPVKEQRPDIVRGFFTGTGTDATPNTSGYWYRIRLDVVGDELTLYLNGHEIGMTTDASFASGKIGIYANNPPFLIDDIEIGDPSTKPVELSLDPVPVDLSWSAAAGSAPNQITVTAIQAGGVTPDVFAATSSDRATVSVSRSGNLVSLFPLAQGTASVRFTSGSDPSLWQVMNVAVTAPEPTEARLVSLAPSVGTLAPEFASDTTEYELVAPHGVATITLTPTSLSTRAQSISVAQDGGTPTIVASGNPSQELAVPAYAGVSSVGIVVTAEDGATTQTYTVMLSEAASTDATLSALEVSAGTLSPAFSSDTTDYSVSLPSDATSMTITPTTSSSVAQITMAQDGDAPVAIDSGSPWQIAFPDAGATTVIAITVVAQDGVATSTYHVSVTRQATSDASLASLVVSPAALAPAFASDTTDYEAVAQNGVTSVTVTVTASAAVSSIMLAQDGGTPIALSDGAASDPIAVPAPGSSSTIEVVVTAEDGTTTRTYTISLRQVAVDDASLASMAVSAGALDPVFDSGTTSYDLVVPNGTTTFTVTPTATSVYATITVAQDAGAPVAVASGDPSSDLTVPPYGSAASIIYVDITAQDGTTTFTYTVAVSEAPSTDATLASLTLSAGDVAPSFVGDTANYAVVVPNGTGTVTLTPTATAIVQSISVALDGGAASTVASGEASGDLAVPAPGTQSEVIVTVVAEDGVTTTTYAVAMTQATATPAPVWIHDDFESGNTDNWNLTPAGDYAPPSGPAAPFTLVEDPNATGNHVLLYAAGSAGGAPIMTLTDAAWSAVPDQTNYYIQARINSRETNLAGYTTSSKHLYLFGRYVDDANFVYGGFNLQTSSPSRIECGAMTAGARDRMINYSFSGNLVQGGWVGEPLGPDANGEWYTLRIDLVGGTLTAYFDGGTIDSTDQLPSPVAGKIGLYTNNKSFMIDDIEVGQAAATLALSPTDDTWSVAAGSAPYEVTVSAVQIDGVAEDAFAANSSSPDIVAVSRAGNVVTLTPVAAGTADITFVSGSTPAVTKTITATITQ